MSLQFLLICVLFIVQYQIPVCGKYQENNLEKLLKLGIKSLDKATGLMQKAVQTDIADENEGDGNEYALHDLAKLAGTGTISTQNKLENKKTHTSQGTTFAAAAATTSRRPTNITLTDKSLTSRLPTTITLTDKPLTSQSSASVPPLPQVFLARTSHIPTQKLNKHLKKRNAPEKLPPEKENQHLRIRERAILLKIKSATDEIETLLQRIIDLYKNGTYISTSAGMPTTPTTTDIPHKASTQTMPTTSDVLQTTAGPYPEAYQGFSPVMNNKNSSHKNSSSGNSKPVWKFVRRRRSFRNRRFSHRWLRPRKYKTHHRHHYHNHRHHHRPKTKILVSKSKSLPEIMKLGNGVQTKGLQMTVLKSSNCSKSGPVMTDVLKTVWSTEKMIHKLSRMIDRDVRKLGNQGVDSSNEERADIKANSDRISQMQKGLSGKIDDIRYNISTMIESQKELGRSVSISLESMMGILNQMVTMVTKRDNQIETRIKTDEKLNRIKSGIQKRIDNAPEDHHNGTKPEDIVKYVHSVNLMTNPTKNNTKSGNMTIHQNSVTKPSQNEIKSQNTTKLSAHPKTALNVTSHFRTIRPKKPAKKVTVTKTNQAKVENSNKILKDFKMLKGRKLPRKPTTGNLHEILKGKSLKTLKSRKPHGNTLAGNKRKVLKRGRPTAANPHKILKSGKSRSKPTESEAKSEITTVQANLVTESPQNKMKSESSTTKQANIVTKPPQFKLTSENSTKHAYIVTKPPQSNPASKSNTKHANIVTKPSQAKPKLDSTTEHANIVPLQNKTKSENIMKLINVLFKPKNALNTTSSIRKPPKNVKIKKTEVQNVGKSQKTLTGGKPHAKLRIRKPDKKLKDGKSHGKQNIGKPGKKKLRKKLKGGKSHEKQKVRKPSKKVKTGKLYRKQKGRKQHRKSKIEKTSKKRKGRKSHRKQKVQKSNKKVKGGKLYRKQKGRKQHRKSKVKKPHGKQKVRKPSKKLKGRKQYKKPKGRKQHGKSIERKPHKTLNGGTKHKFPKGTKPHGTKHDGKPHKVQKGGKPHGKHNTRKPHKTQTSKSGKAHFHNDHAVVNRFKNNETSNIKKKPVKPKGKQHAGITINRRYGDVYSNHKRKRLHRHIEKRDKKTATSASKRTASIWKVVN